MKVSLLTLFPGMFDGPFSHSILKRAVEKNLLSFEYIDIREFGIGKHKIVDDTPYGGGAGMLLRVDVVHKAIEKARCKTSCKERIILLDAGGQTFSQKKAEHFATYDHLILICAHYEGVDERIKDYIDEELSIGDYVLTGGELPAMVVVDTVARLLPGVLGKEESSKYESFQQGEDEKIVLEHPHFTKPEVYNTVSVPPVLLSGHHANIQKWRKDQAQIRTKKNRPDLLK